MILAWNQHYPQRPIMFHLNSEFPQGRGENLLMNVAACCRTSYYQIGSFHHFLVIKKRSAVRYVRQLIKPVPTPNTQTIDRSHWPLRVAPLGGFFVPCLSLLSTMPLSDKSEKFSSFCSFRFSYPPSSTRLHRRLHRLCSKVIRGGRPFNLRNFRSSPLL